MERILALCDYQSRFGGKYFSDVYRSGMDKVLLKDKFNYYGFEIEYIPMHKAQSFDINGDPVLYTSVEDPGLYYKGFIEDIVYALELKGARLIPPFQFLKAINNKVFMEILRHKVLPQKYWLNTLYFGCMEELSDSLPEIYYPCVVKTAEGAVSRGVACAHDPGELQKIVKQMTATINYKARLLDYGRGLKHKGYQKESWHRKKFIVQDMMQGIHNDWKVLVYYDKFYVLRRGNRPGDFRASGSGLFSFDDTVDVRLLEAAREIISLFNVPMISLDLAIKDGKVVLFEFQSVCFGTSTLEKSPYFYTFEDGVWRQIHQKSCLEEVFAYGVSSFLKKGLPA
jgi:hypothetical protein